MHLKSQIIEALEKYFRCVNLKMRRDEVKCKTFTKTILYLCMKTFLNESWAATFILLKRFFCYMKITAPTLIYTSFILNQGRVKMERFSDFYWSLRMHFNVPSRSNYRAEFECLKMYFLEMLTLLNCLGLSILPLEIDSENFR